MFRSTLIARNLRRSRVVLALDSSSKDTAKRLTQDATRIAQDAGRIAHDSSKILVRVFEELSTSNEVKLIRLSVIKVYSACQVLFDKHIMKNPKFQSFLIALRQKLEGISNAPDTKQSLTAKAPENRDSKCLVSKDELDTGIKSQSEKQAKPQEVKN